MVASAFEDLLEHAAIYHKGGKVQEAAVLSSAVLEDGIKRVARKHEIDPSGRSLDPIIDQLASDEVISQVKAKRLKSFAAIRNHALHAEWDKLEIREVGALISGLRDFLDDHL